MSEHALKAMKDLEATAIGGNAKLKMLGFKLMATRTAPLAPDIDRLVEALEADPAMRSAFIREMAGPFLERCGWSMRGEDTRSVTRIRPETDGGGRRKFDSQPRSAPETSDGGEGRALDGALTGDAPPSSNPARGGEGHINDVTHNRVARPVAKPTEENRRAFASVAKAAARTIFDSVEIRGRPLARIAIGELAGLLSLNEQDNALIRQMMRHAANADPLAMVSDVFKASDIERFRQKAAEMADAL